MKTFKDLEETARAELEEEEIQKKTDLLKERIRELKEAEKTLKALKKQYEFLLEKDINEIDDIDF